MVPERESFQVEDTTFVVRGEILVSLVIIWLPSKNWSVSNPDQCKYTEKNSFKKDSTLSDWSFFVNGVQENEQKLAVQIWKFRYFMDVLVKTQWQHPFIQHIIISVFRFITFCVVSFLNKKLTRNYTKYNFVINFHWICSSKKYEFLY